jgi:hypothetical protein
VFRSPRRLDLRLYYHPERSARKTLDVWPAFPFLIQGDLSETSVDDVVAKLEHNDRICQISLHIHVPLQIEKLWTAMRVPFPELVDLYLDFGRSSCLPVIPDSFLGRSAPRLFFLALGSIPFPGLPRLLLSATHLADLHLLDIPHSGYFSPEAMATCLTTLTNLENFQLDFESPQSSPNEENRRSPPPTRSVLPSLAIFMFKGVNEYLEELVARIDAPRLCQLWARFFNDIVFDTPELIRFVSSSSTFKAPNRAHLCFDRRAAHVKLETQTSQSDHFQVQILCRELNWQLSSLAQICTTSMPLLSTAENLFISELFDPRLDWNDDIENIDSWLELLLPFTAVRNLYLSKQIAPHFAPALQEITVGGTTDVLSTLENLYLEGFQPSESVEEDIERFISARQLTNHPVAISDWDRTNKVLDKMEVDE